MPEQVIRPMTNPYQAGIVPRAAPAGADVPPSWLEWIWSIWPPDRYVVQHQKYGVTIRAAANSAGQTGGIQVPVPVYVFGFRSRVRVTADGTYPTIPYRIGIKNATGNDWTNGQWMSDVVTGDANGAFIRNEETWLLPREVGQNEVLTVTVDNNFTAASVAVTVDAMIWGYEVRQRQTPIQRQR